MRRFAELLERLAVTPSRNGKLRLPVGGAVEIVGARSGHKLQLLR
jgi:hypothetical protein